MDNPRNTSVAVIGAGDLAGATASLRAVAPGMARALGPRAGR